jgi:hypothetical protein
MPGAFIAMSGGVMREIALVCLLALPGAGCMPVAPPALPTDNWQAGYFASIYVSEDVTGPERDALTARSKEQADDVVQKLRSIEQNNLAPGCIRRSINECLASLSRTIAIKDDYPGIKNYVLGKTDLSGQVIADKSVNFDGLIPGRKDAFTEYAHEYLFKADVDPNLVVSKLEVSLPADPMAATSAEDYDKTGAFEVVDAIKPPTCDLSRTAFYQGLENNLKKKARYSSEADIFDRRRRSIESRTPSETVCGLQLELTGAYGRSSDLRTSYNRRGNFGGATLTIH